MEFEIDGLEELQESLIMAMRTYGDVAEEELEKTSKEFKKDVIKHTKESVEKRSGKLIRGFKLDKLQGYDENISIDFRGTAPHFHLVENGHEQYNKKGEKIGWVAGRLMVHQTRAEYKSIMPRKMMHVLEKVIEKSGLE